MKMYALKYNKTGELAGFSISGSGDSEFCNGYEVSLDAHRSCDEPIWMVSSFDVAKKASMTDTDWYNASYDTPKNSYEGEWTVVELEVNVLFKGK